MSDRLESFKVQATPFSYLQAALTRCAVNPLAIHIAGWLLNTGLQLFERHQNSSWLHLYRQPRTYPAACWRISWAASSYWQGWWRPPAVHVAGNHPTRSSFVLIGPLTRQFGSQPNTPMTNTWGLCEVVAWNQHLLTLPNIQSLWHRWKFILYPRLQTRTSDYVLVISSEFFYF
jgi:hypothetical protein